MENELMQKFINHCQAVMYIKDEEGRYIWVNHKAAVNLKTTVEELIGKTDYDFFSKEDADRFRENDRKVLKAGKAMNFEDTHTFAGEKKTIIDHKFLVSPHSVGGIAIVI